MTCSGMPACTGLSGMSGLVNNPAPAGDPWQLEFSVPDYGTLLCLWF
jgi:hypothetical protein